MPNRDAKNGARMGQGWTIYPQAIKVYLEMEIIEFFSMKADKKVESI